MSNNALSIETLNELRLLGAWKKMSKEFPWNEEQLERYKNNVDWNDVSGNQNVAWNVSLLERFKNQLNWKELSENDSPHLFKPEIIRAFVDKWDWSAFSKRSEWTISMIEEFKDHIDWSELVDIYLDDEGIFNETFLIKYHDYIKFQDFSISSSCRHFRNSLWEKLCEEVYKKLADEVSGLTKK
ncbi:MAG: hypothetical protein IJ634_08465 [Bacteroidales bacterium]|nr:hypothetical protein [Bacteroidales bacterium]